MDAGGSPLRLLPNAGLLVSSRFHGPANKTRALRFVQQCRARQQYPRDSIESGGRDWRPGIRYGSPTDNYQSFRLAGCSDTKAVRIERTTRTSRALDDEKARKTSSVHESAGCDEGVPGQIAYDEQRQIRYGSPTDNYPSFRLARCSDTKAVRIERTTRTSRALDDEKARKTLSVHESAGCDEGVPRQIAYDEQRQQYESRTIA
jgi:hypothetical protein